MEEKQQEIIDFVIGNDFITNPNLKKRFIRLLNELVDSVVEETKPTAKENNKDEELEIGRIYFISYGGNTQIIGRFKEDDTTQLIFFDVLHYWNGYETFRKKNERCVKAGIEEIRPASQSEKMNLIRFELEHNCI